MSQLFKIKEFISHAGIPLYWKIECDALQDSEIDLFAHIISKHISFYKVYGIPEGGIRLQNALKKYESDTGESLLIVDDVYTTGKSFNDFLKGLTGKKSWSIIGVCLFARAPIKETWVHPVFQFMLKDI